MVADACSPLRALAGSTVGEMVTALDGAGVKSGGQRLKENYMGKRHATWLLPLRSVLFLLTALILFAAFSNSFEELSRWWTVVVLFGNVVVIVALLLVCRASGTTYDAADSVVDSHCECFRIAFDNDAG